MAIFEIGTAVVLLAGMFVVRSGRVRAHAWLQGSMVLLNIPVVIVWMLPPFLNNVLPDLPGELLAPYYLLPTAALVVGAVAEGLGVYIVLVAATNLLPERLRFRRYKLWMRSELALWWTIVGLGLAIYYVWYVSGAAGS